MKLMTPKMWKGCNKTRRKEPFWILENGKTGAELNYNCNNKNWGALKMKRLLWQFIAREVVSRRRPDMNQQCFNYHLSQPSLLTGKGETKIRGAFLAKSQITFQKYKYWWTNFLISSAFLIATNLKSSNIAEMTWSQNEVNSAKLLTVSKLKQ